MHLEPEFLEKYNLAGPRYTSYPPAPHFHQNFSEADYWQTLEKSNGTFTQSVSFYLHIPFCPHRCLYCGCNTEIAQTAPSVRLYHQSLMKQLERVLAAIDPDRPVTQIHFGGGTPNAVPLDYLGEVIQKIRGHLRLSPGAEVAIEADPSLLSLKKLEILRRLGFNRISLGIQDFNHKVLDAVERRIPKVAPKEMVNEARRLGFRGINLDLIYGLPYQTPDSFRESLKQALEASPDRFAIFSYAHVPWVKSHQRKLEGKELPGTRAKLEMACASYEVLTEGGFEAIGMDHYARPDDALAGAMREGKLHRNFQGYCTRETTGQVYALGATGISQLDDAYFQNTRTTIQFNNEMGLNGIGVEKAYFLSDEEKIYRQAINALMCQGRLDLGTLPATTPVLGEEDTPRNAMKPFVQDGLAELEGDILKVTPRGRLVVRCLAMAIDPLMRHRHAEYSRTI